MPRHLSSTLSRSFGTAAALAVVLSACSLTPPPPSPALPQPTLAPVAFHHAVEFTRGAADLTPAAAADLRLFAASLPAGRGLTASVFGHADTAGSPQDARLAQRRATAVAEVLRASGIDATLGSSGGPRPVSAGSLAERSRGMAGGEVEVTVRTEEVVLPGCPNWSREPGYDPGNLPLSNLGCASALNLGLMVADPTDLATRRPLAPADGTQAAEAVVRYRTDKVKPLKVESVQ
jgi:pilus assembly protein CpaD